MERMWCLNFTGADDDAKMNGEPLQGEVVMMDYKETNGDGKNMFQTWCRALCNGLYDLSCLPGFIAVRGVVGVSEASRARVEMRWLLRACSLRKGFDPKCSVSVCRVVRCGRMVRCVVSWCAPWFLSTCDELDHLQVIQFTWRREHCRAVCFDSQ